MTKRTRRRRARQQGDRGFPIPDSEGPFSWQGRMGQQNLDDVHGRRMGQQPHQQNLDDVHEQTGAFLTDDELDAREKVAEALEPLEQPARERVLRRLSVGIGRGTPTDADVAAGRAELRHIAVGATIDQQRRGAEQDAHQWRDRRNDEDPMVAPSWLRSSAVPTLLPDNVVAAARQIHNRLIADPFFLDGSKRARPGDPVRTVRDVLWEQMAFVALMSRPDVENLPILDLYERGSVDVVGQTRLLSLFAVEMNRAIPFLWTPEMHQLAINSPLPEHVVDRDVMPFPVMWFTFSAYRQLDHTFAADGILLIRHEKDHGVMGAVLGAAKPSVEMLEAIREKGQTLTAPDGTILAGDDLTTDKAAVMMSRPAIRTFGFPTGVKYPSDDIAIGSRSEEALQMLSFLASPYVDPSPRRIPDDQVRHARKHRKMELPRKTVSFIALRQVAPSDDRRRKSTPTGRKIHVRFQVRAHHRRQWYPSTGTHKVIWVPTHMRGPLDGPLQVRAYRVNR